MWNRRSLGIAVAAIALVAGCQPPKAPEPKVETDDQKAVYALGLLIAERIEQFGLSESELEIFESGLRDGVLGHDKKVDPKTLGPQLQAFSKARASAKAEEEKTAAAKYLEQMAAEPGATKGPSGFIVKTITEGTGASPTEADTVKVNYHGTLRDGTVFDSSVQRNEPAEFPLAHVIPCWTQALQGMKVGGKYKLTCPADIAYGDRGSPPVIKPGAALTFEIDLLSVTPPEAAAPPTETTPPPAKAPAAKKKGK